MSCRTAAITRLRRTAGPAALYPGTAVTLAAASPQVAVDHSAWCFREGDQAELCRPGQQAVRRHHPNRVAERSGLAEVSRSDVSGHAVRPRTAVQPERVADRVDDLVSITRTSVHHLDADIVRRKLAEGHAGPHGQPASRAQLAVVGRLDVLNPHGGPADGHPGLPGGQLAGRAVLATAR